jgi:hypothetical protein
VDINKIISRAKGILLTPRSEWPVIAAEPETVGGLFSGYIVVMAAIPAIIGFLSMSVIGHSNFLLGTYRTPMAAGLEIAVVSYVFSLLGVFVLALIVEALAPTFGGEKNRVQALKTVAYAYTAGWVASIIGIVPGLGIISGLAGLVYGLYLLNLGLPFTMNARRRNPSVTRWCRSSLPSSSTSSSAWRCGRSTAPPLAWVTASATCTTAMAPPRAHSPAALPERPCRTTPSIYRMHPASSMPPRSPAIPTPRPMP